MKLWILSLLLFSLPSIVWAQHSLTKEQQEDKMVASKIWKPFTLTTTYPTFQKDSFHFSQHDKPIFLYVGQRACTVCSYEFPTYIQLSKLFPKINFVYLTPDDSENIVKKFGISLKIPNLFVIQMPMNMLWDQDIARVFPVKYFVSKSGIVTDASTGGTLHNRPELKKKWETKLSERSFEK